MKYTDSEIAQENWKDIDGYDGMYQVSDLGRVRAKKYGRCKVLKPRNNCKGYLRVWLYKNGNGKCLYIHRLVANAFIPNDDESKTQINHINEEKSENRVSNLEWCTASYNINYNGLYWRRKNYKYHKIKPLYNPDLTYHENIEIFKANGITCSVQTLWRLRKDLGLTKKA